MTQHRQHLGWLIAFTGFCLTGLTAKPDAHHSFAMYDQTVTKTMSGKLVRLIPRQQPFANCVRPDGRGGKADALLPMASR